EPLAVRAEAHTINQFRVPLERERPLGVRGPCRRGNAKRQESATETREKKTEVDHRCSPCDVETSQTAHDPSRADSSPHEGSAKDNIRDHSSRTGEQSRTPLKVTCRASYDSSDVSRPVLSPSASTGAPTRSSIDRNRFAIGCSGRYLTCRPV